GCKGAIRDLKELQPGDYHGRNHCPCDGGRQRNAGAGGRRQVAPRREAGGQPSRGPGRQSLSAGAARGTGTRGRPLMAARRTSNRIARTSAQSGTSSSSTPSSTGGFSVESAGGSTPASSSMPAATKVSEKEMAKTEARLPADCLRFSRRPARFQNAFMGLTLNFTLG